MRRDVDRTELSGGSAYNMVDFIPDEIQAVTGGRGGWTYAGSALTGATQIKTIGLLGSKVIAIDQQPKAWDVLAASAISGTPGTPVAPPAVHGGLLIFPCASAVPTTYDGSTLSTLSTAPQGKTVCVYKNHTVLAGTPTNAQRVYFSAAGDPTSWDTTFGYWDASGSVYAVAGVANAILIFQADSVERLRGTTPPPGSDMVLEPFLSYGCTEPFSVAYWRNNVVFASSRGLFLTDGATVVDLTEAAQMKTYWQSILSGYTTTWRIAGGVYRDHYIVSINDGNGALVDCLCVSLLSRTMWRFTNLHGSSFVGVANGIEESLYMGQLNAGRVAELSSLWSPSASVKQDGDGTNPTPIIETGMFRGFDRLHRRWIESMGKQKWRFAYVDYDLRDAATDNPTMALSYCKTPTGAYTAADRTLPETTDIARIRRSLSPTQGGATHSQMLGLKLAVNGPYASAKLLTLEGAFEPIEIGAL